MKWLKTFFVLNGVILFSLLISLQVVSAQTRITYQRSDIVSVSPVEYRIIDKNAKLSYLKGTKNKVTLISKVETSGNQNEIWIGKAQVTIFMSGLFTEYVQIANVNTGVTGWIPKSLLRVNQNLNLGVMLGYTGATYRAESRVAFSQLTDSNHDQKLIIKGYLTPGQVYVQTAFRIVDQGGEYQEYSLLKNIFGVTAGWVRNSDIKWVKLGTTSIKQIRDGVNVYGTAGSVLSVPKRNSNRRLVRNGQYLTNTNRCFPTQNYIQTKGIQNVPDVLKRSGGYLDNYHFETSAFMPEAYMNRSLYDPQSATFSIDDHYLYVMYVDVAQRPDSKQSGWVVRYDWKKLQQLRISTPGHMAVLRQAMLDLRQQPKNLSRTDRQVLACIKVGPKFESGHAQTLSLNPKNNELWFTSAYGLTKPNVAERLNPDTLKPDAVVEFDLGDVGLGSVLCFDEQGNAYTWTHIGDSIQLYKGNVEVDNVHFKLIGQRLVVNRRFLSQSISYNDVTKRLYLVADGNIISFPVGDIGRLTTGEIGASSFYGKREFEGLIFMHHSNQGFLLTNQGVELMKMVLKQ